MEEVVKTHLPLLAWEWHEDHYRLIYDDKAVGELAIDENGRGWGRYHEQRWLIDPSGHGEWRLRDAAGRKTIGSLHIDIEAAPQEGRLEIQGKVYRCLRDSRKIPVLVTLTGAQSQPLLQFREEDEDKGKIQIDNQQAAALPEFEILALWGMYLYLDISPSLKISPTRELRPARPQRVPRASRLQRLSRVESAARWLPWALAGIATLSLLAIRLQSRPTSNRSQRP
jgi:hypothetical protein